MAAYYPPVGFHFRVEVGGLPPNANDIRFTEVGGLAMELGTEEVAEGGENRFVQKYPTRARYTELTLKRGLLIHSAILDWIRAAIEDFQVRPTDLDVTLLNDAHEPLLAWHVTGAYPTKWSVSDLNASGNAVVIESLQLFYQRFRLDRG